MKFRINKTVLLAVLLFCLVAVVYLNYLFTLV